MTRLIIDGNSHLNAALLRGIDHDQGRVITNAAGKQVQVNSAQYGIDGFFDKLAKDMDHFGLAPRQVLVVWDGKNAKLRRRTFLPNYKIGRDKEPEVSAELNKAREQINDMLYHLGACSIVQDGMEADDVLGWLAKHLRTQRNIISTADGDISVLVDDNTDVWRLGELNRNPFGGFPHKYITVYKALVGDSGDKIPGAKDFGDKTFCELVRIFGLEGLDMMIDLIENDQLPRLREDIDDFPKLKLLIEHKDMVATSWRCARLHTEDVNTLKRSMDMRPGMVGQWDEVAPDLRVFELKHFYGTKTLVTASNYAKARERVAALMAESPFVGLDIETSASDASDEWIESLRALSEKGKASVGIDVLGHELTGMSLTLGANTQHTIYMTVDHADSNNITVDQCREMVEVIPQRLHIIIQNRNFEFTVLYRTWGGLWKDNGWHGFVPNALDTKIGCSYVDENLQKGLKANSKHYLNYEQQTYEQVTTLSGKLGTLPKGGQYRKTYSKCVVEAVYEEEIDQNTGEVLQTEVLPAVYEDWEDRQYRMNELSAAHVFDYGCDDTICCTALHTHYQLVMEMEGVWETYLEVETLPEYLTTLAFVTGFPVSQEKLREMSSRDDVSYEKAWATLRGFLMNNGWDGTICPEFEGSIDVGDVKLVLPMLVPREEAFATRKRKMDAVLMDLEEYLNGEDDFLLHLVRKNDVNGLNAYVKSKFTGEPVINFASPKQMQNLFYRVIGIPPRIMNPMTQKQREENDVMRSAFNKRRKLKEGKDVKYTPEELDALISKSSTDDQAIATALNKDRASLTPAQVEVLQAFQTIKTVMTRRSLFYRAYRLLPHWRDGRIHPSLNQCEAVTRRYSASKPNIQQLPKRGDGAEFRQIILPHHREAVVVSLDFAGQELRLMAHFSGDANLTACYVGDNLKDVHGLTAAASAIHLWGEEVAYEAFMAMLESKDPAVKLKAKMLRGDAKTVNFGTQYDMMAESLSLELMVDEETAQQFIDAKDVAFPGIELWKVGVRASVRELGYAKTLMGARRHLAGVLNSPNRYEASKADRQGPNHEIQGSAAEMSKLSMSRCWSEGLFTGRFDAVFIAPIHDELVFSVHRKDALELIRRVHACMVAPYGGMDIPIVSSVSLGKTFGQQVEAGDFVDDGRIQAILDDLFKEST